MPKRKLSRYQTAEPISQKRRRYAIPDRLNEDQVARIVQQALCGGKDLGSGNRPRVLWEDAGDQVLVHVDSVVVRLLPRTILVSTDLETDQTGVGALIVTFALGSTQDKTGLFAMSEERVRGHPLLASRWGAVFRETVWSALLGAARTHAVERAKVATALHPMKGKLTFAAAAPIAVATVAATVMRAARARTGSKS